MNSSYSTYVIPKTKVLISYARMVAAPRFTAMSIDVVL